jgi:hypothetical protein
MLILSGRYQILTQHKKAVPTWIKMNITQVSVGYRPPGGSFFLERVPMLARLLRRLMSLNNLLSIETQELEAYVLCTEGHS